MVKGKTPISYDDAEFRGRYREFLGYFHREASVEDIELANSSEKGFKKAWNRALSRDPQLIHLVNQVGDPTTELYDLYKRTKTTRPSRRTTKPVKIIKKDVRYIETYVNNRRIRAIQEAVVLKRTGTKVSRLRDPRTGRFVSRPKRS